MEDICLKKVLESDKVFPYSHHKLALELLCCHVCKQISLGKNENLNKYEKINIYPLFFSQRRDDNRLLIAFGCRILEDLSKEFGQPNEEKVKNFFQKIQKCANGEMRYSYKWLLELDDATYCKIISLLYFSKSFDLMYMLAIQYIFNNNHVYGSNVRFNWIHRDEKEPFFQIGISIDEGIVQTLTMEISSSLVADESEFGSCSANLSDSYFFEMKFVDNIIKTFDLDRKEFLGSSFSENCLDFLNKETSKVDICDFYNLLLLSDKQKWKEVHQILKKYNK